MMKNPQILHARLSIQMHEPKPKKIAYHVRAIWKMWYSIIVDGRRVGFKKSVKEEGWGLQIAIKKMARVLKIFSQFQVMESSKDTCSSSFLVDWPNFLFF
jgi:hypothetical protein